MPTNIVSLENAKENSGATGNRASARNGGFPEHVFPPRGERKARYERDVAAGYKSLQRQRVVIAGLARDVADILPTTIRRIERQGELFADYRVVIFENDSADDTATILAAWAQQNTRVTVVSQTLNDPVNEPTRCLDRAGRMAHYRSQCQHAIASTCSDFDHVMIVDTDLGGGWSYDGVAHTFGQGDWDFVGANGLIFRRRWLQPNRVVQYDAWAYRDDELFTPLTTKQVNYLLFRRGEPMHAVYSCFGGVGIYRMPAYLAGRYEGTDVEHVTFHQTLHRQGYTRTFLNPSLIAIYGRKHRSLDKYARPFIQCVDQLTFRRRTTWQFDAA